MKIKRPSHEKLMSSGGKPSRNQSTADHQTEFFGNKDGSDGD